MIEGIGGAFRGLGIASSGLTAQRVRMETIARNIANAETTRTQDGAPYQRQIVQLAEASYDEAAGEPGGVTVAGVEVDPSEGPLVYDPGHPDADEAGYVRMPNVDMTREMTDLMETRRLYEANATVFEALKAMLSRSTRI